MKVPFFDLKRQTQALKKEVLSKFEEVIDNTAFTGGPFVEELEGKLQTYLDVNHAIAVNNGTNALYLALTALGIKPGDEVIVPANTFVATAWAPSYLGATPVFVDCDEDTWNICPQKLEKAITPKTKLIMAVHLYGQVANLDAIMNVANMHGIPVIEDNAQALGATYKDRKAGTYGVISCTSFYPGKNLGAWGEAGAAFTNDEELAAKMRMLRNHGCEQRYHHDLVGYNMRMSGFQGAALSIKLDYLDGWIEKRQHIAKRYRSEIQCKHIKWQQAQENSDSVYHLFVITTDKKEALLEHMKAKEVGYAFHYPIPCHLQKAYHFLNHKVGDMPNSEYLANNCVSLPMFPEMTNDEISSVIHCLNNFL